MIQKTLMKDLLEASISFKNIGWSERIAIGVPFYRMHLYQEFFTINFKKLGVLEFTMTEQWWYCET